MKMIVSLAQICISFGNPQANLSRAEEWISQAHDQDSNLILFPELWTCGYDLTEAAQYAQENVTILSRLSSLARKNNLFICGSMIEKVGDRCYNTFYVIQPDGEIAKKYRKAHLFRLMAEEKYLSPGDHLQIYDLPSGKAGLAICYDLRFPEFFRKYALEGVRCILLPAEWPLKRAEHWKTLLRARAIENQFFMIAVNAVGQSGGETFGGNSAVIDPWGVTLAECSDHEEELISVEIDLDRVDEIRKTIPVFTDRRPELYT